MKKRTSIIGITFLSFFAVFALSMPALAVDVPASASAGPVPGDAGTGLSGRYWDLGVLEIDPTADGLKNIGFGIINSRPPTATFTSTRIDYDGNDLTLLADWLAHDAGSIVGGDPATNNFDDGLVSLTGFIAVEAAGAQDFYLPSDDGTILNIGGVTIIDNDGGHGQPGPNPGGSATFAEAGLYPMEIAYFNGDWTNAAGDHGGANIRLFAGSSDAAPMVATSSLYPIPEPSSLILAGLGLAALLCVVRRRK